jgi:hypothetical protein
MKSLEIQQPMPSRVLVWSLKWLSGFVFSFMLSVAGLTLIGYGSFSFVFVLVCSQILFWKVFHNFGLISILVFDAIMVFLFLALRLYVVLGPDL